MFFWFLVVGPRRGIEEGGPIVEFPHVIGGTFRCFGGGYPIIVIGVT
jgi:hypothetical protein